MKTKKGFALATTLVVMVLVLALSNLLLVLAGSTNTFAKSQTSIFEHNQQVFEYTQNFADLNLTDFKLMYADYTEEILGNTTKLISYDQNSCLEITTNDTTEILIVKNYDQTITFATIQKDSGLITLWQIES